MARGATGGFGAGLEGWEEPLRSGSLGRRYPTLSHFTTHYARFLPPRNTTLVQDPKNIVLSRGSRRPRYDAREPVLTAAPLQALRTVAFLQVGEDSAGRCA